MKQFAIYFLFLFVLLPSSVFARSPLSAELISTSTVVTNVSTVLIQATTTDPIFIDQITVTPANNGGTAFIRFYCGVRLLYKYQIEENGFSNAPYSTVPFPTPLRCTGALWAYAPNGAGSESTISISGYSMTDANFDVSSGGGGGGSSTTTVNIASSATSTITAHSFDGFYLFFGIIAFAWAVSFYVWYFRKRI